MDELRAENLKLLNELKFAQKNIEFLDKFKNICNNFCAKCICDSNIDNKIEFSDLDNDYKTFLVENLLNKTFDSNIDYNIVCNNSIVNKVNAINDKNQLIINEKVDDICDENNRTVSSDDVMDSNDNNSKNNNILRQYLSVDTNHINIKREITDSNDCSNHLFNGVEDYVPNNDLVMKSNPIQQVSSGPNFEFSSVMMKKMFPPECESPNIFQPQLGYDSSALQLFNNSNNSNHQMGGHEDNSFGSEENFQIECDPKAFEYFSSPNARGEYRKGHSFLSKTEILDLMKTKDIITDLDPEENIRIFREIDETSSAHKTIGYGCGWDDCDYISYYRSHVSNHIRAKHTLEKPFSCEKCDFITSVKSILKTHIKYHHESNGVKYKCDYINCEFETNRSYNLTLHKRRHTGIRSHVCDHPGCDRSFFTTKELNDHKMYHSDDRPFICQWPECEKTFKTKKDLKIHNYSHTGERPYMCQWPDCGKGYIKRSHLARHELTHMGIKEFVCDICGKGYTQKETYNKHMENHEQISKDNTDSVVNEGAGPSGVFHKFSEVTQVE